MSRLCIQEHVPLAHFTSFRIGGEARFFVEATNPDEVTEALTFARERQLTVVVLGGGTKVLVADEGFQGLVIKPHITGLSTEGERITAGAGVAMGQVVAESEKHGLLGMEWAAGLPGTVGGAVHGNSGCYGGEMREAVASVLLLDPVAGSTSEVLGENLEFSYRSSRLKRTGEVVLHATLHLRRGSPEEAVASRARVKEVAMARGREQPIGEKSAGSAFVGVTVSTAIAARLDASGQDWKRGMNRAGHLSAGWVLESLGLKGYTIGGAGFSPKHANFILNHGTATAADIVALITLAKARAREHYGIDLAEEIQYVGIVPPQ